MSTQDTRTANAVTRDIVAEYAISPQEAERLLKQFSNDKEELDLLLGNRGARDVSSPNLSLVEEGDFLFEI